MAGNVFEAIDKWIKLSRNRKQDDQQMGDGETDLGGGEMTSLKTADNFDGL
jgi:hypothetical protein